MHKSAAQMRFTALSYLAVTVLALSLLVCVGAAVYPVVVKFIHMIHSMPNA